MPGRPHVVFVPGGGAKGAGEQMRSLVLADAVRRRWPDARVGFITDERHPKLPYDTFERHRVRNRISKSVPEVNRLFEELRPDVVIFDCRGRGGQIAYASRVGARTVYVAQQPQTLRRALRWRRLRHLDELWVVSGEVGGSGLRLRAAQRLRLALARRPRVRSFDAIFPVPDPGRHSDLRQRLGLDDAPYLLFAPGGGGYELAGRPVPELFAEAAQEVSSTTGLQCVVVMGPLYAGVQGSIEGVRVVDTLEPMEMIEALAGARLAVLGGGSILGEAIVLGKPCLAVPAGGTDQPDRIRRWAEAGLVEFAPLDPPALADPAREDALIARVRSSGWRNGLPEAVARIAGLLGEAGGRPSEA